MPSVSNSIISSIDHSKIERAIQESERKINGEIVPSIVHTSDQYPESYWKASVAGFFLGAFTLYSVDIFLNHSAYFKLEHYFLAGFITGALMAVFNHYCAAVKRHFISPKRLEHMVNEQAHLAFLHHEVFKTKARSGVLIFVSLFEHKVVILGDSGIYSKVKEEEWAPIAKDLSHYIKEGDITSGLCETIQKLTRLLVAYGFKIEGRNEDELTNKIHVESEDDQS
jgi:putative membrane protein